jgi:hypothetical protein
MQGTLKGTAVQLDPGTTLPVQVRAGDAVALRAHAGRLEPLTLLKQNTRPFKLAVAC